jgi:hypothetical protein
MLRTAGFVLLGLTALDLVMLMLLLATVWVAHRAVRRKAASEGEHVPSAAGDFRLLFGVLLGGLVFLGGAAALLLSA